MAGTESPEAYWKRIINADKAYKLIRYTPSMGVHYFWYKSRPLAFSRTSQQITLWGRATDTEDIYLSCLGRNTQILKDLLEEAKKASVDRLGGKTVIHRAAMSYGHYDWRKCMTRPSRPLSTVILDDSQKQALIDDVTDYLNPATPRWYANRGIPYRRGYLLHGPPGTGKSRYVTKFNFNDT